MIKNATMLALISTTALTAYDSGTAGWKMDGDKLAVDGDGNPVWINAGGQEQTVKGDLIPSLRNEAKTHREAREKAEGDLAKYRDESGKLIDPETALKAVDTVSKIDAKTLIDAGKVDEVREQMRNEFTTQLNEQKTALNEARQTINSLKVDKVFDGSEFVRDRINVPADMFRDSMSKHVKVNDNGELEFYDRSGNRLMSRKETGQYATGDEAFELLVNEHPQRDTILRAPDAGGTGGGGGGGNRGGGRNVKRSDFDAADPHQKAQYAQQMQKGEISIVD